MQTRLNATILVLPTDSIPLLASHLLPLISRPQPFCPHFLTPLGRCGLMPAHRSSSPMPSVWAPWRLWGATTSTNTTATGEASVFSEGVSCRGERDPCVFINKSSSWHMCDIGTVCCWEPSTVVPVLCLASQYFPSWASWHKSKGWTLLMWQSQVRGFCKGGSDGGRCFLVNK